MAILLKGADVAQSITEDLTNRCNNLKIKGVNPKLAMIMLGEDEAALSYARNAKKKCEKIGIEVNDFILEERVSESKLLAVINRLNSCASTHGVLMFRPIYDRALEYEVARLLDPAKDVDAMTPVSLAGVFTGRANGFCPCTAQSCIEILDYYGIEIEGKNIAVIGRSPVVGKPLSMMLQNRNATVTMCHTKTRNLAEIVRNSEILIVAAGRANIVTKDFVNENHVIIDVGINFVDGKICGDVDFSAVEPIVKAITPVPGGVGAVTTSVLAKHVIEAAENRIK